MHTFIGVFTYHLNVHIYTAPDVCYLNRAVLIDVILLKYSAYFISSTYVRHEFKNFWHLCQVLVHNPNLLAY